MWNAIIVIIRYGVVLAKWSIIWPNTAKCDEISPMTRWYQSNFLGLVEEKVDGFRWGFYSWKREQRKSKQEQGKFEFFHHLARSFKGRKDEARNHQWDHEGPKCRSYRYLSLLVCTGLSFNMLKNPLFLKIIEMVANYKKGFKPSFYQEVRVTFLKKKLIELILMI